MTDEKRKRKGLGDLIATRNEAHDTADRQRQAGFPNHYSQNFSEDNLSALSCTELTE